MTKEQLIIEYKKCLKSTPYALRTYLQTYDNTISRYVPLELFSDQFELVNDYENFNENIALKYRQAGVSTVTAAWASKRLAFARKEKPEKVLIIANKLDTSVEFANKIRAFIEQWPSWVGIGFSGEKNAAKHYKLNNGCEVKAVATSKDALRGYTPTILIFDEAAFIEADSDFWPACMASLSTGGKVIVISTPNGFDPIYYEIYDQTLRGMNDFKITEMYWFRDPRYTRDLYMVKCNDIVHYLLNKEEYPKDVVVDLSHENHRERTLTDLQAFIADGYKPCSSWFESMVKKFKYDKRKVAQELECNFLGSGDNVFDSQLVQTIMKNDVREPAAKLIGGQLWIWKEPENGHKYVMGIDVSRGDSEDFSCIEIIDFDSREQVLEFVGKVPPDILAEIGYKWGNMYNALCVTDLTGGMGVATSRKLQELGYELFYYDGVDMTNLWKFDPRVKDKIPGINFNSKRVQIIAAFEENIRHEFKVRSSRLINEMGTFVYINGRPDHQRGHHDDCIMSIAIALYAAEAAFPSLVKVTNHTKAMINSWATHVNENTERSDFFNPMIPQFPNQNGMGRPNQQVSREDYQKYGWLFGIR